MKRWHNGPGQTDPIKMLTGKSADKFSLAPAAVWATCDWHKNCLYSLSQTHRLWLIRALPRSLLQFNFVGKLLGPRGNSLKRLQEDTLTKMSILGKGSMRDKEKVTLHYVISLSSLLSLLLSLFSLPHHFILFCRSKSFSLFELKVGRTSLKS